MSGKRASGTREWASRNVNCCAGCCHGCLYCYGRVNALRFGRIRTGADWTAERINDQAVGRNYPRYAGTVMFPTAHDICPHNLEACLTVLDKLLRAGSRVLIVSKPHFECLRQMRRRLRPFREQVLFRFTITCVTPEVAEFWEPGAPSPFERLAALAAAHKYGFATSVSCEPLLEPEWAKELVSVVDRCVTDTIWIGKANHLRRRTAWCLVDPAIDKRRLGAEIARIEVDQTDEKVRQIYESLKAHPKVRWKDSYKDVLGIPRAEQAGMDV